MPPVVMGKERGVMAKRGGGGRKGEEVGEGGRKGMIKKGEREITHTSAVMCIRSVAATGAMA